MGSSPKRVLLVDPLRERDWLLELQRVIDGLAHAQFTTVGDYPTARALLRQSPPDLLVTNVRLRDYNGIQLAILASASHIRCIVYAKEHDGVLARQVQNFGAFYIRLEHVASVLSSFVLSVLPAMDRRDPELLDRRQRTRCGRRSTDLRLPHQSHPQH